MSKGSSPQNVTTTTSAEPSEFIRPYVQEAMDYGQDLFQSDTPNFFPNNTYIDPSAETQTALDLASARAIAGNRPILLADEPTGNLDIASGKEVLALFKELCHDEENPISILMVTHDPDLASNADRMLLMKDGKTEASDIRSAWGLDDDDSGEEE